MTDANMKLTPELWFKLLLPFTFKDKVINGRCLCEHFKTNVKYIKLFYHTAKMFKWLKLQLTNRTCSRRKLKLVDVVYYNTCGVIWNTKPCNKQTNLHPRRPRQAATPDASVRQRTGHWPPWCFQNSISWTARRGFL